MSAQFKAAASYQQLSRRIQQQIARARDREQFAVTVYRFDEDHPTAWDRMLNEFEELALSPGDAPTAVGLLD